MNHSSIMKVFLIIILSFLAIEQNHAQKIFQNKPAITIGFINDNYTGDEEMGIKGRYFGPDDFLTFSMVTGAEMGTCKSTLVYNILTSRKYAFRSDLITSYTSRSDKLGRFILQPGVGIVLRNNFSGEELQNWFHELTNVPEIYLPYTGEKFGLLIGGVVSSDHLTEYLPGGDWKGSAELRFASGVVPSRCSAFVNYRSVPILNRFHMQFLGGVRVHLNEEKYFSEMLRSGIFGGAHIEGRLFWGIRARFGVTMFPGKNLENDPLFKDKDRDYYPQIATMISWNGEHMQMNEFLIY